MPPSATTSKLRLFWDMTNPQYTFDDIRNQNPLGDNISMNAGPGPAIFHPEDFGAVYNNSDPTVATANSAAISAIIAAMSDMGGVIEITADLFVMGGITNPLRVFSNGTQNPIHFIVQGATGTETWTNLDSSLAFVFDSEINTPGYAVQYGSTVHKYGLRNIQVTSKDAGCEVFAGGKSLILENVIFFGCYGEVALFVQDCDGMQIRNVYCIANHGAGAVFENCHQCAVDIIIRGNAGGGLGIQNCAGWRLWANVESNWGQGVVIDQCKEFLMNVWQENNNTVDGTGEPYVMQGQMTNCTRMQIVGIDQQESALDFDCDAISRAGLMYLRVPDVNYQPYTLGLPWPSQYPAGFNLFAAPYKPTIATVGNQIQVTFPPASFTNQPTNVTENWMELFGYNHYPQISNLTLNQGDSILVRIQVQLDAATASYFRSKILAQVDAPAIKAVLEHNGFGGVVPSQTFYLHDTNQAEIEIIGSVTQAATDFLRLFLYFCPVNLAGSEPPTAMNFFINGAQMYRLPAAQ
jgi:hypothetical protein